MNSNVPYGQTILAWYVDWFESNAGHQLTTFRIYV